jgi:RHS repeat-associated protein
VRPLLLRRTLRRRMGSPANPFNGKTTTYTYDSLNRLLSRSPDPTTGESPVTFTYTATGKRHTMADASGTTTYTYDSMDRLVTKAAPEGTLNYTYDAAGHLASMTSSHTNGVSVGYTYDSLNRLSTVVDGRLSGGNQTTTYQYDGANNVFTVAYPNGITATNGYDALNRISGLGYTTQSGVYTYTRDNAGKLINVTEPISPGQSDGRQVQWTYDGINRLTNETISLDPNNKNGSVGYGLDPVGNRTSLTSSLSGVNSASSTFNANDERAGESYDANGNVTAAGGKTFSYDSENHLVSMNGGAVTIVYDGDGNRVAKTVNGVTTQYLVDDLNPTGYPQVVEELVGGAVARQYTYGLQPISQNQSISSTWTPSFYGYDGLGTVRQLTSSGGSITDTYDYDAFGNEVHSTGTTPNNHLYRGEQFDSDLGLYYLRARYYNPTTGRFMSRDPENPGSFDSNGNPVDPKTLHKYLYADGDPVNGFDPTGHNDDEEYGIKLDRLAVRAAVAIGACGVAAIAIHDVAETADKNPSIEAKFLALREIIAIDIGGCVAPGLGAFLL